MADYSIGHQCTVSIGGTAMAVNSCGLRKVGSLLERPGLRGTRAHDIDDVRAGQNTIAGTITINPTNAELTSLLAYAMGPGNVLNEALGTFTVIADKDYEVWTYTTCKVSKMTITGRQGQMVECAMDIVGKAGSQAGSAPAQPTTATPLIFTDVTLTVSNLRQLDGFVLTVDNAIEAKYRNKADPVDLAEGDRIVTLQVTCPYGENTTGLRDLGTTGSAGTLAISGGPTFSLTKMQIPFTDPTIEGKAEEMLTLDFVCRKDGATAEFTVA